MVGYIGLNLEPKFLTWTPYMPKTAKVQKSNKISCSTYRCGRYQFRFRTA
jgi:hypothetical protein